MNDFYVTNKIKCPVGFPENSQRIHITDTFKLKRGYSLHTGVDIDYLNRETNINAVLEGEIVGITYGSERNGSGVWFQNGEIKTYLEDNEITYIGDFVQSGDLLGKAGITGKATGIHLHLEVFSAYAGNQKPNMKPEYYIEGAKFQDENENEYKFFFIEPRFFLNVLANTFYQMQN